MRLDNYSSQQSHSLPSVLKISIALLCISLVNCRKFVKIQLAKIVITQPYAAQRDTQQLVNAQGP